MDTLEVLMKARGEVEKGWCRIDMEDADGNVCALGALQRTRCHWAAALDALKAALPSDWPNASVSLYNDMHTKADVLALFDRAIAAEAVKVTADPAHVHAQAG